jgi:hypothetical protein
MSRKRRKLERQKKLNSEKNKRKREKKAFYASYQAKEKWREKQAIKEQKRLAKETPHGFFM